MANPEHAASWIEFSLQVDFLQAEAVSTALMEILPTGLVVERIYDDLFPDEVAGAEVPARILAYLPDNDRLPALRSAIMTVLGNLPGGLGNQQPHFEALPDQNWATAWQVRYQPIPLGERMIIVPSWLENPHPERLEIKMEPGMAFGSGTHPTTQLCLRLIEASLAESPAVQMIDIGCGSGILAIAAAKLGADQVLGVDTDPEAVRVATANALLNQVAGRTSFGQGSVQEVLAGEWGISKASLVAANIIAPILRELIDGGLDRIVSPGGTLLLSGILQEQLPGLLEQLKTRDLILKEQIQDGDWLALRMVKTSC